MGGRSKHNSGGRSKTSLFGSQIFALLRKRMLTFTRDKRMWAWVIVVPALFVLLGALIVLSVELKDMPALTLTPTVRPSQRNL